MTDTAPPWLAVARKLDGVKEFSGAADNPVILDFAKAIGEIFTDMKAYSALYRHDATAWCGLFAAYCMASVGYRPPFGNGDLNRFLWAQSWAKWGTKLDKPKFGCVMVFTRTGGGHVAFYEREDEGHYYVRGGNQADAVNVARFPKTSLIAAVWPKEAPVYVKPEPTQRPEPPEFSAYKPDYAKKWGDMAIDPGKVGSLDAIASKLLKSKHVYQDVEKKTGVPWWFIAVLHNRESSGSFAGVLHNGDDIIGTGRLTYRVPKGRGPFSTWADAAVDALRLKGLQDVKHWTVERVAYEAERYNGFGYRKKGVPSAYLWSFSSIYKGGKYVADGVWSSSARDAQAGVMPLLKRMMALDPTIKFASSSAVPAVVKDNVPGTAAGGLVWSMMAWLGANPLVALGVAVAVAVGVYLIMRKIRSV